MVAGFIAARFLRPVQRLVLVGAARLGVSGGHVIALRAYKHLPEGEAKHAVFRGNLAMLVLASAASIDDLALALHSANLSHDRCG